MSENSTVTPLNWPALVNEAIRRRKAEKLTQKEHAALASVSIPTILAFDRAERTLSLSKAFDILRVVGLIEEQSNDSPQERFVQEAFARWRALIKDLPADSPARFPHGWYRIDYELQGELVEPELHKLLPVVEKAEVRHTGWPMFITMTRPELAPREIDGVLECWIPPADDDLERLTTDAAHCDFWRITPTGRALLIRGYSEDTQDTFKPATIFDTTLPIWRIGEGLLHAARLAKLLARSDDSEITVRFRIYYTGLQGRVLRAWANPMTLLHVEGGAARSSEAMLETTMSARSIEQNLTKFVTPLVASLYERFSATGLPADRVNAELERMVQSRF